MKYYVVTEYWNNGEGWRDASHSEEPIAVYKSLSSLQKDMDFGKYTSLSKVDEDYVDYIYKFREIEKRKEELKCPFNKEQYDCEYDCIGGYDNFNKLIEGKLGKDIDKSIYYKCKEDFDSQFDNSYVEYYVYEVGSKLR